MIFTCNELQKHTTGTQYLNILLLIDFVIITEISFDCCPPIAQK